MRRTSASPSPPCTAAPASSATCSATCRPGGSSPKVVLCPPSWAEHNFRQSLFRARDSAQGDLAGQQAGAGAALVGRQRLRHREGLLQAGLELRRGGDPLLGRCVGREVPHGDDETERAKGAGVPGALAEGELLGGRQPGERVEERLLRDRKSVV